MVYQYVGAAFVLLSCGGFGISIAAQCANEERLLRQLLRALQTMRWELQYRLTPLPQLCRIAGEDAGGYLKKILLALSDSLERQLQTDAGSGMNAILQDREELPRRLRRLLLELGKSLGRFDLEGQLQGLQAVEAHCREELDTLRKNGEVRRRSYRTLAFSAGIALVILFL